MHFMYILMRYLASIEEGLLDLHFGAGCPALDLVAVALQFLDLLLEVDLELLFEGLRPRRVHLLTAPKA